MDQEPNFYFANVLEPRIRHFALVYYRKVKFGQNWLAEMIKPARKAKFNAQSVTFTGITN